MSDFMREFLSEWLEWACNGGQRHPVFSRDYGLCQNLKGYCREHCGYASRHEAQATWELDMLLYQSNLRGGYPFGVAAYHRAQRERSMHLDPTRLRWVCEQLGVDYV